jgi:hypothetical protein
MLDGYPLHFPARQTSVGAQAQQIPNLVQRKPQIAAPSNESETPTGILAV